MEQYGTKLLPPRHIDGIIIELVGKNAIMPVYAKDGDSGLDVCATEDICIAPGETELIKLGFKMAIPKHPLHDYGYRWECQARPRSGLSLKTPLRLSNAPGTIDNGYRGEVGIIITNTIAKAYDLHVKDNNVALGCLGTNYAINLEGKRELVDKEVLEGTYLIKKGDRIAQLVFNEVVRPVEIKLGPVDENTDRGNGGFGSTGV